MYGQKELIYQRSIYMHIERFGMLKVKGVQFRSGVANARPTSFMLAGRCIIRIGWKIGASVCVCVYDALGAPRFGLVDDSVKGKVICKAISCLAREEERKGLCLYTMTTRTCMNS